LAWNLFLACLPLLFSTLAGTAKQRKNKPMFIMAIVFWLAFFPNAPYMITDFIHVSSLGFYSYHNVVEDIISWFGLVYMTVGIVLGILIGTISLDNVVQLMKNTGKRGVAVTTVVIVSLISGYALYIGRFLRFNSWNLFYPFPLLKALIQDFSLFTVLFSLLSAAYIAFSYLIYCILKKNK
jgi:uncharacterized membrane protein